LQQMQQLLLSWCLSIYFHLDPFQEISLLKFTISHSFWEKKLYILEHKKLYSPHFVVLPTCPGHLILLHLITQVIFGNLYKSWCSSLYSLLHSMLPRPSYAKIHYSEPNFKHPQLIFLPQCERESNLQTHTTYSSYTWRRKFRFTCTMYIKVKCA
jgi:hypothetical protein